MLILARIVCKNHDAGDHRPDPGGTGQDRVGPGRKVAGARAPWGDQGGNEKGRRPTKLYHALSRWPVELLIVLTSCLLEPADIFPRGILMCVELGKRICFNFK